jgi:ubiquinone/menaquinone biosynthesis C-methylase UbiE
MSQVEKSAYSFEKYCGLDRWSSYHYQLREILKKSPETVLEVGGGDGVVMRYLRANTNINYKNLDIAEDLSPDILGSVESIPLPDSTFDLVCAFEILEHLPFEKFEQSLKELARISKKDVLISLPHFGPAVKILLKVPFLSEVKIAFKIPYPRKHVFNGQHYWEIGKMGFSISRIRELLANNFVIKQEFVPFENQYHHFFILEKK